MRRLALSAPLLLLALALTACAAGSEDPDRFTYVVRYAIAGTVTAAMDVTYTDAAGASVTVSGVSAPWSLDLPSMDYDYDNPFTPSMRIFNTSLADGESFTPAISWLDYKVGFGEEVLADRPTSNASGGAVAQDITLGVPPLPL